MLVVRRLQVAMMVVKACDDRNVEDDGHGEEVKYRNNRDVDLVVVVVVRRRSNMTAVVVVVVVMMGEKSTPLVYAFFRELIKDGFLKRFVTFVYVCSLDTKVKLCLMPFKESLRCQCFCNQAAWFLILGCLNIRSIKH